MRRFYTAIATPLLRSVRPARFLPVPIRFFSDSAEAKQKKKGGAGIFQEGLKKRGKKEKAFQTFEDVMNFYPEVKGAADKLTQEEKTEILEAVNYPAHEERLEMEPNPSPDSLFIGEKEIEWIQSNPAYEAALEQAVERDYITSLGMMWVAYEHFEAEIGPCCQHLLYIIRRLLWIGRLAGRDSENLEVVEKGFAIAKQLYTQPEHEEKLRVYEEMLISHCFQSDVSKALLVVQNALERRRGAKEKDVLGDLRLLLYEATASGLTGQLEEGIEKSQKLYEEIGRRVKELGKQSEKLLSGTLINLAVMKFEQVRAEGEAKVLENESWSEEEARKNGKIIEECIFLLKAAVNIAENVPERFGGKEGKELSKAQKMFKELFDPSEARFIGVKQPDYSLKERVENDALVRACFTSRQGALGVMNLGYMAYHMHAPSEALTYLDIASRALGGIENGESLSGKAMGLLAASFGQLRGNERMTRDIFEKVLEKSAADSVERAEALELYGQTLMKEEATKYEGEEMLEEATRIQAVKGVEASGIKRLMVHPEVSKEI